MIGSRSASYEERTGTPLVFPSLELPHPTTITATLNPFGISVIQWQLIVRSDHLKLSMGWGLSSFHSGDLIRCLPQSVSLGPYLHGTDATLAQNESPHSFVFISPDILRTCEQDHTKSSQTAVFPSHGNEGLKMIALAAAVETWAARFEPPRPFVLINRGACINCLLSINDRYLKCGYICL